MRPKVETARNPTPQAIVDTPLLDETAPAAEEDAEEMLRIAGAAALWVHEEGAAGQVPLAARRQRVLLHFCILGRQVQL